MTAFLRVAGSLFFNATPVPMKPSSSEPRRKWQLSSDFLLKILVQPFARLLSVCNKRLSCL
jgi:hypothetical protein